MKQIKQAVRFLIKHINADDYTIYGTISKSLETRFAQNRITQNIQGEKKSIYLDLRYGKKQGFVNINSYDEENLLKQIEKAKFIALNSPDNEELMPSQPQHEVKEYINYDLKIARMSMKKHVDIAKICIENAIQKNANVSGFVTKYVNQYYIVTKNGANIDYKDTSFSLSMTMEQQDRRAKTDISVWNLDNFNLQNQIDQLNQKFDDIEKNPVEMNAKPITVILKPLAVSKIYQFMSWFMDQRQADLGFTPFSGKINQKIFGDKFSLYSTLDDQRLIRPALNHSLIPNRNIHWIKNGTLKNLQNSEFYAKKQNIQYNGSPYNIVIDGGNKSDEDLMKLAPEGLIINNFWYIRVIDNKTGELTGLTRDGVIYFKNGKKIKAVNNFRWNEIPQDMTKRIIEMGPQQYINENTIVPTMMIKEFNLVDNSRK